MFCQLVYKDGIWNSVKNLTKVKVNNIQHSSLIHLASQLIVEGYQVGKAWFPHCKSILTFPDRLLVLRLFENGLQDYLLHHLLRDWVQAYQAVVPLISSLALLEDRDDIYFLPVFRNISWSLQPFKDSWVWRPSDISQLPQHLCVQLVRLHGLIYVHIVWVFPDIILFHQGQVFLAPDWWPVGLLVGDLAT